MMKKKTFNILESGFAELLLESMADGVFTLDANGVITSWNPAMERISGYMAKEVTGKTCKVLKFNRCFGEACPTTISECGIFQQGSLDAKECMLRHKSGENVPVVKSARLVRNKKNVVKGVVESVADLTELYKVRREVEEANRRLGRIHQFENIIGKSSPMQQVFSAIKSGASSDANILVQGESGTGKELVAGAIHYNSYRAGMPFVIVNCSALAESLLESELFGHIKGAFTGATRNRAGRFEEAAGGTIFLDEIGDISPFIQVKLLRVLQEREFERVGESKKRKVDIRIITATNRNLYSLVNNGSFREDLYYRLKVFPIDIPPLRKRKEDIPILTSHFITVQNRKTGKRIAGLTQPAMRILLDYNWAGNVRELENAIEHAFVLCTDKRIDIFDLPVEIRQLEYRPRVQENSVNSNDFQPLRKKPTREILLSTLRESDWNKAEVARRLGFSRAAIWKYMKKWGIPMKKT